MGNHLALRRVLAVLACAAAGATAACGPREGQAVNEASSAPGRPAAAERLHVTVLERVPMPEVFTQGLEAEADGTLLVGTGQYGRSQLMRLRPGELAPVQSAELPATLFGEGITAHAGSIWQLTWKEGQALRYDARSLAVTGQASYPGEGWGLCSDGQRLYMSDGTDQLRRVDPETFAEDGPRVRVTLDGVGVTKLNELECADGAVYANVWLSDDIVRIDPRTGKVTALIDAAGLAGDAPRAADDVLNGIAHIPGTDEFWITGKRWGELLRARFE